MCQPKIGHFICMIGSLPYPPCDTNYKVIVYEDIGTIGRTNLDIFKHNIGNNTRVLQEKVIEPSCINHIILILKKLKKMK